MNAPLAILTGVVVTVLTFGALFGIAVWRDNRTDKRRAEAIAARGRLALMQVAGPVIDDALPRFFERLPAVPYGTVTDEAERICKEAAGG